VRIGHRDSGRRERKFQKRRGYGRAVFVFGSGKNEARKQRGKRGPGTARRNLVLGLLFQFGDKAGTNTVGTGEEAAPEMLVAPEIFASLRVENGEIGIASGRSFVVIGDGVFGDVTLVIG
jgi:hypothetical protein